MAYTYEDLLRETNQKKIKAQREIKKAIRESFLAKAEFERKPGTVAWLWLAKEFCEILADHVGEWTADVDSYESREIGDIYMAYEDGDSNIYELLPTEARLFDGW